MRYFVINQNVLDDLVAYSREIVKKRGYPVEELVYGLQNREIVSRKMQAEYQEMCQASLLEEKRSKAANYCRYAILLDVVSPDDIQPHGHYVDALSTCYTYGFDQEEIEIAMRIKYGMRRRLPYRGESETPEERALRKEAEYAATQAALDIVQDILVTDEKWPGWTLPEVSKETGIPLATLYSLAKRSDHPDFFRKSEKTTLINMRHPEWLRWLRHYHPHEERVIPSSEWPDPAQDERVFS